MPVLDAGDVNVIRSDFNGSKVVECAAVGSVTLMFSLVRLDTVQSIAQALPFVRRTLFSATAIDGLCS